MRLAVLFAATSVLLAGCSDEAISELDASPDDAGPHDAGALDARDALVVDVGALDAEPVDATELDASGPDAGDEDAGALDAGPADAGALDAGLDDAGALDAGLDDAGALDAGLDDAGALDAGLDDAGRADAGAAAAQNIVFVTERSFTGDLGGLVGADAICAADALAAGLPPNTYVAWLGTSTTSALSRLGTASGWVRPDGRPVFADQAAITGARVLYPPSLTAAGADLGGRFVRTGTLADGSISPNDCAGWTDASITGSTTTGNTHRGGASWTALSTASCGTSLPIYCFGVDNRSTAEVPPVTARRAFVTTANFRPGMGLAAADALCMSSRGALTGTFRALLGTTTSSPASRFDTSGLPWARVDGVLLSDAAASTFSAPWLAALDRDASGTPATLTRVWLGATAVGATGTPSTTCVDWSATLGFGSVVPADATSLVGAGLMCSGSARIFCLEE